MVVRRVCVLALLSLSMALPALAQDAAAQPEDNWEPTEIKNLTVLPKETSPADVMKIMRQWNEALNVDCVFCHVGAVGKPLSTYDFASDNKKRKEVSRLMMRATADLDEKFKDLGDPGTKVTCATCHRRSRHPEIDLPPAPPKAP
jgi:hypothetical protein